MFLIDEDKALKERLQGVKVSDDKNPERPVGVWFGQPDTEIRAQSYPYLTLDLVDVSEAVERAHRGIVSMTYQEGTETKTYAGEYPIPVNLDYVINSYARQPRHDRQIIAQLMYGPLPLRMGALKIGNTHRRLDFLGFAKRDTVEGGKRLFVNTFTVRISSEIIPGKLHELIQVREVNVSLDWTTNTLTQPTVS